MYPKQLSVKAIPSISLETLFTSLRNSLLAQGARAIDKQGIPRLRHQGRKSAYGFVIADFEYQPTLEHLSFTRICSKLYGKYFPNRNSSKIILILRMQEIHNNYPHTQWERLFCEVAKQYKFKVKEKAA